MAQTKQNIPLTRCKVSTVAPFIYSDKGNIKRNSKANTKHISFL